MTKQVRSEVRGRCGGRFITLARIVRDPLRAEIG